MVTIVRAWHVNLAEHVIFSKYLLSVLTISAEGIAESLAGTDDSSTDETMHSQATDCKALHALANPVNVDQEDQCACFIQRSVSSDSSQV